MNLSDNIRAARKKLKMSQDELAEAIGANRVTISRYETGSYLPSVPALERLAEALGMTPSQLTGGAEPKTDAPKTMEAKLVSGWMDQLPKDRREQIKSVVRAMCSDHPEIFLKGEEE